MTLFILKMLKAKLPIARLRPIRTSLRQTLLSVAKRLGLKILTREDILGDSEKYHVLQFGSEEYVFATPPHNDLDEVPSVVKDKVGTWTLKKPFVFEVPNAELIGTTAHGAGLTNIIFSRNLTVSEIFSLAKALGFQYGCLRFTSPELNSGGTI